MIKLVAIDLDGTLLNRKKEISIKNKETIKKAKQLGTKIVICTGRPLQFIHPILEKLGLEEEGDYSITFNGGMIQKNDTGEILAESLLSLNEVYEMCQLAEKLGLPIDIVANHQVYQVMPVKPGKASLYKTINPAMKFSKVTLKGLPKGEKFNKMVVAVDSSYLNEKIKQIPQEYYEKYNLVKSRDCLLEVMNKEVSKSKGIEKLIQYLGIEQSEIMAIGDEENDLDMIEYAEVGVAMENGIEEVKEMAQYITADCDHDGVAQAILKYVMETEGGN